MTISELKLGDMRAERVKHLLKCFVISEPLKTMLGGPYFEVQLEGPRVYIALRGDVQDAYGKGRTDLVFRENCPYELHTNPEYFCMFLRGMLHRVMEHEVDESILVNGQRIFDPHRGER